MRKNVVTSKLSVNWRKRGNFGFNYCYSKMIMTIYMRNWLKTMIASMIWKGAAKSFRKLLKLVRASLKAHKAIYESSPEK